MLLSCLCMQNSTGKQFKAYNMCENKNCGGSKFKICPICHFGLSHFHARYHKSKMAKNGNF